jgi:PBP1b-binding outer membrane lipoprotein LpoB
VRHFLTVFAVAVVLSGCQQRPPPEDANMDAAEDNALSQIQSNAQQVQAAGVILSDPNIGKPPSGGFANVQ